MGNLCCAECFGDRGLRHQIAGLTATVGDCSFCRTLGVPVVPPNELADYFELLAGVYESGPLGMPLVIWFMEDWKLFSNPCITIDIAQDIVTEILGEDLAGQLVSPSRRYSSEELDRWQRLRDELMHKNRYFPDQLLDGVRLRVLLSYLHADPVPTTWYRARIRSGKSPSFAIGQMGAPPEHLATHGRANPPGIPYLYLASRPETAVAEVRPHTGATACVAEFVVAASIKVVDLRDARLTVSPFLLEDQDQIGLLRVDIAFLEQLGRELTKPVLPDGAAIDYVPSQYLCEFIKKCGYDGVLYGSSVSDGINLALFDPATATGGGVSEYVVERVVVQVAPA